MNKKIWEEETQRGTKTVREITLECRIDRLRAGLERLAQEGDMMILNSGREDYDEGYDAAWAEVARRCRELLDGDA